MKNGVIEGTKFGVSAVIGYGAGKLVGLAIDSIVIVPPEMGLASKVLIEAGKFGIRSATAGVAFNETYDTCNTIENVTKLTVSRIKLAINEEA